MAKLDLRHIRKQFGPGRSLSSSSLEVASGELVSLLGPSGCGKTTALRIVAGFEQPTRGELLVDGNDITGVPANKRNMGMVFQAYSLFPNMTARQNVEFGLRVRKRGPRRARASAPASCSSWSAWQRGPSATRTSSPAASSSASRWPGRSPSSRAILLLDEPLSALDAKVRVAAAPGDPAHPDPARASPRSTSPTTRKRRCRSPTASPSCPTGNRADRRPADIYRSPATGSWPTSWAP